MNPEDARADRRSDRAGDDQGAPTAKSGAVDYGARLSRCRSLLDDLGLAAALVSNAADLRYLTGFRGDEALVLVSPDRLLIATDARYWAQVREEAQAGELVEAESDLIGEALAAVGLADGERLGFQGDHVTYAQYRRLRRRHRGGLRDLRGALAGLRVIKDAAEIETMRRAAALTETALAAVVAAGLVGRSEADVSWALQTEFQRLGAEGEAFATIVAAGDHAAHAHAIPGERIIAAGELVVIDLGAKLDGYCSDLTRTFAAGRPGADLVELYEIVLAAQEAGVAAVRAGAHGRDDVDAACRRVIEAAGYGAAFTHGTGHGVGLEIHEAPALGKRRGDVLRRGMVCTVEPGIYLEGRVGIRIEDSLVVTDAGSERLTRSDKALTIVD